MPTDTKRISGPESSSPYRLYSVNNVKTFEQLTEDVFTKDGLRKDKRKLDQTRKIYAKVGIVSQAKGSAYIEMGNTKVIVSVFEPREIPKQTEFNYYGELFCEFKYAPFSCTNRCQHQPGNEERELAASIRRALEPTVLRNLFENFQIDIQVYVLENDGSVLSAAIIAAGLALADGEIPIYDIITATTIGIQGSKIFVDPTAAEEQLCLQSFDNQSDHGIVVLATLPTLEQVTEFWQHGSMSVETLVKVTEMLKPACSGTYSEQQMVLSDKLDKYLNKEKEEKASATERIF